MLKPSFKPLGQITAGNSSPVTAGATCVLVIFRERADRLRLNTMASLISFVVAGVWSPR